MSETRYPAWWEEGAPDRFSIVMHPDDKVAWLEGIQHSRVISLSPAETADLLVDRGRRGAYRIGGIPVVLSPHAVPGHPTVMPSGLDEESQSAAFARAVVAVLESGRKKDKP